MSLRSYRSRFHIMVASLLFFAVAIQFAAALDVIYGNISGTVTTEDGSPVNGGVYIYDANGNYVGTTQIDADGWFRISGLLASDYYVKAVSSSSEYFGQIYGGESCGQTCDVTNGTPVFVAPGKTTANINLVLKKTGAISGTVTGEDGGAVSGNAYLYDANGSYLNYVSIDSDGHYLMSGLSTGSYYLAVYSNTSSYFNQIYSGKDCNHQFGGSRCDAKSGTPVSVTTGQTTASIDFVLKKTGVISGAVTKEDGGAASGYVVVYDARLC